MGITGSMRENNKESLTQKVVLAGKYGFWYKDLKNLFEKENWDFFCWIKAIRNRGNCFGFKI